MAPSFPRQIQAVVLWFPAGATTVSPTGLSPSTAGSSNPLRLPWLGPLGLEAPAGNPQPHIPPRSSHGGLVWSTPLSVAPTQGIPFWFLFLPLLRCFRSGGSHSVLPPRQSRGGFPSATGCSPVAGGPIRGSRVQRLHAPTPGISPLAAPFVGARAEPSTGRRPCRRRRPARLGGWRPVHGDHRPTRATPFTQEHRLLGCIM